MEILLLSGPTKINIGTTVSGYNSSSGNVFSMPIPTKGSKVTIMESTYLIKSDPHFDLDKRIILLEGILVNRTSAAFLIDSFLEDLNNSMENPTDIIISYSKTDPGGIKRFTEFSKKLLPQYEITKDDLHLLRMIVLKIK